MGIEDTLQLEIDIFFKALFKDGPLTIVSLPLLSFPFDNELISALFLTIFFFLQLEDYWITSLFFFFFFHFLQAFLCFLPFLALAPMAYGWINRVGPLSTQFV